MIFLEDPEGDDGPYLAPQFIRRDPIQELADRELSKRSLLKFIQRYRPKYDAGWVHQDICRRLERFVQDVADMKEPRMLLMMPPRAGKSEIGSRHLPAWALGHHPDWEIIAASHTSSLSLSFSRYIRDLLRDPSYHDVFPDTVLDPSSQSIEKWNLTKGGGYLSAGVGTGITGRGAHILLLDDLVKDVEAADSANIRNNTWEWYISTAYTRLAPGGGVLGIMTWWNDDDWAGRIQQVMDSGEGDTFEIVKYPALNEYGPEYLLPDDKIIEHRAGEEPPPEGSYFIRPIDTALHPARYSTEAMHRIKRNLTAAGQRRIWSSLYQQNPAPEEGAYFNTGMFRYYSVAPARRGRTIYQAWDFAITEGEQNDYTVGVTLMQDEYDNLYVLDVRRFKSGDSFFIIDAILDYAVEYDADLLGFEDGQIWKAMASLYQKRAEEKRVYKAFEVLVPLTDKMVRANPLRGRMQLGKVYFEERGAYFTDLKHEMLRFPAGKHDDQIDALAWAVRLTLSHAAPRIADKTPEVRDSWRKRLGASLHSGDGGHMSA